MSKEVFDHFTIEAWEDGYTLKAKIMRPPGSSPLRRTETDRVRERTASQKNVELADKIFATLEELMAEIKILEKTVVDLP